MKIEIFYNPGNLVYWLINIITESGAAALVVIVTVIFIDLIMTMMRDPVVSNCGTITKNCSFELETIKS